MRFVAPPRGRVDRLKCAVLFHIDRGSADLRARSIGEAKDLLIVASIIAVHRKDRAEQYR